MNEGPVVKVKNFEVTLMERPMFGDRQPAKLNGQIATIEKVAKSAGAARMSYLRNAWSYGYDYKIGDIRVRTAKTKQPIREEWERRVEIANKVIQAIAAHGRHFLSENSDRRELVEKPFIGYFFVDKLNEIWFVDSYTKRPVLTRHQDWPGFSPGGTMRSIIENLSEFIRDAKPVNPGMFGPFPLWRCGGDVWGYGLEEMAKVRAGVEAALAGGEETENDA